jgi:ornithine decarboxylase
MSGNDGDVFKDASDVLADMFRENNVYLGGSSLGKGLKKAACFYMGHRLKQATKPDHFQLPGSDYLNRDSDLMPLEDSFYVVDLGVLVSQVYQWRKSFPRVEPFYAVKCNPDPLIIRTLAVLGTNFDCASRNEIRLVKEVTKDLQRQPEIIYANPCKARTHLIEAVCQGVKMVTFDNAAEVEKCASISKSIQLVLRIMTDDRGSQCRLSSKFGAPPNKWKPLLAAAKKHGLQVTGVSFHVGSGCRDATRYELALKDARSIFDMAEKDFGFHMNLLDIGGGFPGETHSLWNPESLDEGFDDAKEEAKDATTDEDNTDRLMFFNEIAGQVAPVIDELFPPDSGVRIIGEPGRYLVAAAATLVCSVVASRSNEVDCSFDPEPVMDDEASGALHNMSREDEENLVDRRTMHSQRFFLG